MGRRCNGEGSIYKRSDDRWCGSYFDAAYNRHYVYGKTKGEVKQKLKVKMSSDNVSLTGPSPPRSLPTFQEWVLEFLRKYKKNELKATTYGSYISVYTVHIENSKIGKMRIDRITTDNLQKYYNDKIAAGYNSKTVRSIETIINSALNQAIKLRMISENPNLYTTIPKKQRYEAKVLSKEDVEKILHMAKSEYLYPIIITTVYTGLRKGEVMALKWENIDFSEKKIHVKNSLCRIEDEEPDANGHRHAHYEILEPKTRKSIRTIPMLDVVYEALLEQKQRQENDKNLAKDMYNDQGLVFANPFGIYYDQRVFHDKYHQFLEKYDLPIIRFHDLRHTFATLLIESDISMKIVQELLGHSTITTSMDIYTHVSDEKKEQALKVLMKAVP